MNNSPSFDKHIEFYQRTIASLESTYGSNDDLCFVYVQHAFLPLKKHLECLGDRFAALIPKASSSTSNRDVVKQLEAHFPGKVYDHITRAHLRNEDFSVDLLKRITQGRRFAILEYGGYFSSCAEAIANDPDLGPRLVGFVEGTENGIKGADDRSTVGYQHVAKRLSKPIVSKSRSRIKMIMDKDIGPAIVRSCELILQRTFSDAQALSKRTIGVVGAGSIGKGMLKHFDDRNIKPTVTDNDISVMADLAHDQYNVAPIEKLLAESDLIFLNTGSCFLAHDPELLCHIKEDAILVLCTSGDVEAGIPQLLAAKHVKLAEQHVGENIACYKTFEGKRFRIMLGGDSVGQAPNLVFEAGSESLANLMSDMEFYGIGCYLGSQRGQLPIGTIIDSPIEVQNIIFEQWLQVYHPYSRKSETDLLLPETTRSFQPSRSSRDVEFH